MKIDFRYSTLKLVPTTEDGDIIRALNSFMGVNRMTSKAMTSGTDTHNWIKDTHHTTGRLPEYIDKFITDYFNDSTQDVTLEERRKLLLFTDGDDEIYLSGEADCVLHSSNIVLDWKSSFLTDSTKGTKMSYYLNSDQIDVYSLLWPDTNKGMYIKLNNSKILDSCIKRLDPTHKERILETYTNKAKKLYAVAKDFL